MMSGDWSEIVPSEYARLSINPLRKLKFEQKVECNPSKKPITLQLGDPTIFGNFPPPAEVLAALKESVEKDKFPYNIGQGKLEAREAVAAYSQHMGKVTSDDIVLSSGCGHAMEMCILTLVSPGETLLIPRPCYK